MKYQGFNDNNLVIACFYIKPSIPQQLLLLKKLEFFSLYMKNYHRLESQGRILNIWNSDSYFIIFIVAHELSNVYHLIYPHNIFPFSRWRYKGLD